MPTGQCFAPWALTHAESARSIGTAIQATTSPGEASELLVARVAVRHNLYAKVWAEEGQPLEARLWQRLQRKPFEVSLVLVGPRPMPSSSATGVVQLQAFGSNPILEGQLQLQSSDIQQFRWGYKVWNAPREKEVAIDVWLPRLDEEAADASEVAAASGWHYWIVADLQHSTRSCQIRQQGIRLHPGITSECASFAALAVGPEEKGWGAGELLAISHYALKVHEWEGIAEVTIALPALIAATATLLGMWLLTKEWERAGGTFDGLSCVDLLLWPCMALYNGTAAHRVAVILAFLDRSSDVPGAHLAAMFIIGVGHLLCSLLTLSSWLHIRAQLAWPKTRRLLLGCCSLASFWFFGAGVFFGPLLGLLAAATPFKVHMQRWQWLARCGRARAAEAEGQQDAEAPAGGGKAGKQSDPLSDSKRLGDGEVQSKSRLLKLQHGLHLLLERWSELMSGPSGDEAPITAWQIQAQPGKAPALALPPPAAPVPSSLQVQETAHLQLVQTPGAPGAVLDEPPPPPPPPTASAKLSAMGEQQVPALMGKTMSKDVMAKSTSSAPIGLPLRSDGPLGGMEATRMPSKGGGELPHSVKWGEASRPLSSVISASGRPTEETQALTSLSLSSAAAEMTLRQTAMGGGGEAPPPAGSS